MAGSITSIPKGAYVQNGPGGIVPNGTVKVTGLGGYTVNPNTSTAKVTNKVGALVPVRRGR